jgi:sRNA-binding carbon storage regulator CsrA
MLIVKRKIGESVMIGDIEVIVLGKNGKQLSLCMKLLKMYLLDELNYLLI